MDFAVIRYTVPIWLLLAPAIASAGDLYPSIQDYTRAQAIKNYVLARCVSLSYKDEEVVTDAKRTAAAYLQFQVNASDAEKIYDLLLKLLRSPSYASQSGAPLHLMRCIDFMNSKQVQSVIDEH